MSVTSAPILEAPSMRPITTKDVAALAGVNRASVSVVLNGARSNSGVSEETRQRILQAAEQLGYRRNSMAAGVRSGRFNCVALLQSTETKRSSMFRQLFHGLHDTLYERNLHVLVSRMADQDMPSSEFVPKVLKEWLVDGLLINYVVDLPSKLAELIEKTSTPAVWVNIKREKDCVYIDDVQGGYFATKHLIDLGHRHIAYVSAYSSHYSLEDRKKGYLLAMEQASLQPEIHIGNKETTKGWIAVADSWTANDNWPTAIVSYSYTSAHPLLTRAAMAGLRVPQDLSIINFDEDTQTDYATEMKISTCMLPNYELGKNAVEMLCQRIDGSPHLSPIKVPFTHIEGETIAPLGAVEAA